VSGILFSPLRDAWPSWRIPENARFERYIVSNKQLRLRPDPNVADSKFLYFWFSSPWMREPHCEPEHRCVHSADFTRHVTKPAGKSATTSRAAADCRNLIAYDELIENNRRRVQILDEIARTVYREWFVEFRHPRYGEVKLVQSPLGPVPQSWSVKKLSEIAEVNRIQINARNAPDELHYIDISSLVRRD